MKINFVFNFLKNISFKNYVSQHFFLYSKKRKTSASLVCKKCNPKISNFISATFRFCIQITSIKIGPNINYSCAQYYLKFKEFNIKSGGKTTSLFTRSMYFDYVLTHLP